MDHIQKNFENILKLCIPVLLTSPTAGTDMNSHYHLLSIKFQTYKSALGTSTAIQGTSSVYVQLWMSTDTP